MVHSELKDYLTRKEEEVKKKAEEWTRHSEKCRVELEEAIEKLTE